MINLRFFHTRRGSIIAFFAMVLLLFGWGFSSVYAASASGFKIFTLKHISSEAGRKYLSQVGIGPVSQLSGSPSLLVTGKPEDVARAKVLLDLVDGPQEFGIKVMGSSLKAEILPASEAISEKAGGILVGTFSSPPKDAGQAGAIVDVYNGSLVIVAQRSRLDRIIAAVGKLLGDKKKTIPQQEAPVEPKKTVPRPTKTPSALTRPELTRPKLTQPKVGKIEVVGPADANSPQEVSTGAKPPRPIKVEPPKKPVGIYKPTAAANAADKLTVTLPPKLDIIQLLQLAGEFLNLNFLYDPVKIKGEVTILWTGNQKGTIKVSELYPLMESVLKFHGFAMTRNDEANMVTVTPLLEAVDPEIIEGEEDKVSEYGHVVVTRIFKLEHIDAASAKNLLDGMDLGKSEPVGDAKVLFVTGYAYRMPRVERLLKMIDKPGKPKKIRFRTLQYTMATALAPKVKSLAEELGTVQITVGQMAASPSPATSSAKKPGETPSAYARRLATERASKTRALTTGGARTSVPSTTVQPGVFLDADERTNRILMIGFDEELDSVEELIDALDVEQTDLRALKLYNIENVDADQARMKLAELGIVSGGGSTSSGSRITDRTSQLGGATKPATTARLPASSARTSTGGTAQGAGLVEEPQVVIIEPTNSLLVNATAEQHTQIELILKYVDAVTDTSTIPYVIYPLENQKPEDLAGILEKLIQETVKGKDGKIDTIVKKTDEDIVIVPDENTFSIIVYASKKNQEWIKNLIETLDKRRPQVLIDVTLVEVSKGDIFEYDLNAIQSFPNLLDTSGVTSALMPGGDPNGANLVERLMGSSRDRYLDFQVSSGRGTGFYADRHINALMTLMRSKDYGRVLAKPKILVNDNETGTISTTDTTYVQKTSSIPLSTGTGTNVTSVTTAIDYTDYDAGINLDITPHISEGDLLRLEITLTRSDFDPASEKGKPPDTTSSDLSTIVTVPDGSTIILGGMIKLNQGKGGTKVPFFGDLPLIGVLFRSTKNTDLQRRLYIFVKAEIIRPAETLAQGLPDLERISQRNRLAFEKFEQKFQNYKSFPGMKSKPMDPLRVLDTE